MRQRIWEIDCLRGIAIIMMAIFHLVVDLKDFYGLPLEYLSGGWYYEGKVSAILFIFLAGVSSRFNRQTLRHSGRVMAAALIVSLSTYLYNSATYVQFGILHFLALSILINPILQHVSSYVLIIIAVVLLSLQIWTERLTDASGFLLPFGITPPTFTTIDYYPMIPWLGVFIIGMAAGRIYIHPRPLLPQPRGVSGLCWLGRHSLIIYMLHQPVMLAVLFLLHSVYTW